MKPPPGMVVDHINRNGLDNRESNLRNCTRLQNLQNRYWAAGQSQYRGVSPVGDKWQAVIGYNNETIHLGLFEDEVEAAKARDRKAYELAGPFAYLNFPDEIERKMKVLGSPPVTPAQAGAQKTDAGAWIPAHSAALREFGGQYTHFVSRISFRESSAGFVRVPQRQIEPVGEFFRLFRSLGKRFSPVGVACFLAPPADLIQHLALMRLRHRRLHFISTLKPACSKWWSPVKASRRP